MYLLERLIQRSSESLIEDIWAISIVSPAWRIWSENPKRSYRKTVYSVWTESRAHCVPPSRSFSTDLTKWGWSTLGIWEFTTTPSSESSPAPNNGFTPCSEQRSTAAASPCRSSCSSVCRLFALTRTCNSSRKTETGRDCANSSPKETSPNLYTRQQGFFEVCLKFSWIRYQGRVSWPLLPGSAPAWRARSLQVFAGEYQRLGGRGTCRVPRWIGARTADCQALPHSPGSWIYSRSNRLSASPARRSIVKLLWCSGWPWSSRAYCWRERSFWFRSSTLSTHWDFVVSH